MSLVQLNIERDGKDVLHCGICSEDLLITSSGLVCACGIQAISRPRRKELVRKYPRQVSQSPLDRHIERTHVG